jgi:hypothetical protein
MITRIGVFVLAAASLMMAASKTYNISLLQPAKIGGVELKAGEYKVEVVDENKAIFRNGKLHGEAAVKLETSDKKYQTTSVRMNGDTRQVQEIRVGGTKTRMIFTE